MHASESHNQSVHTAVVLHTQSFGQYCIGYVHAGFDLKRTPDNFSFHRRAQNRLISVLEAGWMMVMMTLVFHTGRCYSCSCRWDHCVSNDLVTWARLPPILLPSSGGLDADGCFTGNIHVHPGTGVPMLFYTGTTPLPLAHKLDISSSCTVWLQLAVPVIL